MAITQQQENALVDLVRQVAQNEITPRFRRLPEQAVRVKSSAHDLVTEADLAAEAAITAGVNRILPAARVVGEEAVAADPKILEHLVGAEYAVLIDPVDGTWNYANGLATHGVLLAVMHQEQTILGLLYDPVMDDWILARRGGGSWFCTPDTRPVAMTVSETKPLTELTGFMTPFSFPAHCRQEAASAMLTFGRAHTLRCACHEYRMLVQGNVDFYINASAKPWDHAAGVLALEEAGGKAGFLDGRPYSPLVSDGFLVAANSDATLDAIRHQFGGCLYEAT
jgi:fructose-1,6-bisphosphatase/inositol monophosphatase family enzyme